MGVIYIILASLLKIILLIPLLLINGIVSICKWEFDSYCYGLALGEDLYGNFLGKYTWNWLFLKKTANLKYGEKVTINGQNYYVTISRVTANNLTDKELKETGELFADILISTHDKAFNK